VYSHKNCGHRGRAALAIGKGVSGTYYWRSVVSPQFYLLPSWYFKHLASHCLPRHFLNFNLCLKRYVKTAPFSLMVAALSNLALRTTTERNNTQNTLPFFLHSFLYTSEE
jgi:hypothetical protein